ncbi:hypothetical protein GCM10011344_27700 [Dokdonia pacifica]|uniref:DUF4468 domain-containing protein n=1 Tax=Dokdonia pacifica TaxID=1627892 RepID=A0A239CEG5_9FLAO|nr:hypothetical protein [Dokdonia pacifica]GGG25506.1 hypothetical protein GCM10011344_27700 [Dokdonia pacifica]SNS18349.1 hypothetical protein SAMN06265376_107275 [Dokdonia pacifica]
MKHLVIALLLLIQFSSFSQNVNDYQYVIIPEKYDFAKSIDEYQLNSLTQFLFNKYGFDSYRARDEKPLGLKNGSCSALYADVESDSNFIVARLKVILKDCDGKVIFITEQGKSKDKDFKRAYHEALRKAFISLEELKYVYNGTTHDNTTTQVEETPEIKEVTEVEIEEVIPPKEATTSQMEEVEKVVEEEIVEKMTSLDGTYQSADGTYKMIVSQENFIIYEGSKKIGTAITNDNLNYEVLTTQFNGKGRFENNNFVIDRIVKGIGVVQMIFSKS